jgi:RNA polymerase sigma factor (sigma-70 family)
MNGQATTMSRGGKSSQGAFPEKANPNRPARATEPSWRETRGEARPYPESCSPHHSRGPMTEAQRELATQYMPMARILAREAMGAAMSLDELEAEAYAALVDAARTFDPDRGVNFAVHARPRIVGALRDYRRFLFHAAWKGDAHESPVFQRSSTTDEINGRVLGRERQTPAGQEFETYEAVDSVIRLLPESHAVACRLIYIEGKSQDEAAEVLGCSKGYFSRLHSEAITRVARKHREALAG